MAFLGEKRTQSTRKLVRVGAEPFAPPVPIPGSTGERDAADKAVDSLMGTDQGRPLPDAEAIPLYQTERKSKVK